MVQRDEMIHSGKIVEETSKQNRRRKLFQFGSAAESVQWFAESFGLIHQSVNSRSSGSGEVISVPLSDSEQQQPSTVTGAERWTSMLHYRPSTFLTDLESRMNFIMSSHR